MGKQRGGSVRLRKDGRWEGRVVTGRNENGYPTSKSVLGKTKAECLRKLKALRESMAEGQPKPAPVNAGMTFGAWLDLWYKDFCKPTIRPKTQADYENRIYQHIIPALGSIPLNRLTQSDLQRFYRQLKEGGRLIRTDRYGLGLSDRMVKACHVICRMALDKAVAQGLLPKNPAAGCKAPATHPREMQTLTAEELQRLLIQAKEDGCFELLLLELSTGLRRGEILALQWNDLDFQTGELWVERQVQRIKGQLTVSPPKTASACRSILLPSPILNILKAYRGTTHSRWVFPSPRKADAPMDPAAVRKKLSKTLERAGCKHVRFHDLRHTFATNAIEHGMDIKTLSVIIGHVSSKTTLDVYAHVTDGMRQAAAARIDQHITGTSAPKNAPKGKPPRSPFQAVKGKYRKPGTGCISRINDRLWEGRYSPRVNGKRLARNVYAHSREECEAKLAEMIRQMRAEIAKRAVCG